MFMTSRKGIFACSFDSDEQGRDNSAVPCMCGDDPATRESSFGSIHCSSRTRGKSRNTQRSASCFCLLAMLQVIRQESRMLPVTLHLVSFCLLSPPSRIIFATGYTRAGLCTRQSGPLTPPMPPQNYIKGRQNCTLLINSSFGVAVWQRYRLYYSSARLRSRPLLSVVGPGHSSQTFWSTIHTAASAAITKSGARRAARFSARSAAPTPASSNSPIRTTVSFAARSKRAADVPCLSGSITSTLQLTIHEVFNECL